MIVQLKTQQLTMTLENYRIFYINQLKLLMNYSIHSVILNFCSETKDKEQYSTKINQLFISKLKTISIHKSATFKNKTQSIN